MNDNNIGFETKEFRRQLWESLAVSLGPSEFDNKVPALDVAEFAQPVP